VYKAKSLDPLPPRRRCHGNVTDVTIEMSDRGRHSLEHAINSVLLESTTRETYKFMGNLESSRTMPI
jgi:hypothetical protein